MFKELFDNLLRNCPGTLGILVMGYDGIAIEQAVMDEADVDVNLVGVELSHVVKDILGAAELLHLGGVQELSIKCDSCTLLIRPLTDDYFAVLVLRESGNFGKARYLLRRDAHLLQQALVY